MRGQPAANIAHLDGAGIAKANLLTRATANDQIRAAHAAAPDRFTWFCSADPSSSENIDALMQSVKSGARGLGEMKYHLATDGPEFRRAYLSCFANFSPSAQISSMSSVSAANC
jgi:uncharacterized protein